MHAPERTLRTIDVLATLALPPSVPRDIDLFSSNTLFGEPGIYPAGSPMEPASGPPMDDDAVRAELERVLASKELSRSTDPARIDDPQLVAAIPDTAVRAALVSLAGTVGEMVFAGFPSLTTAKTLRFGTPTSPGRIVGPSADGDGHDDRVVSDRYRAEHFALIAPSLVHDLLWTPDTTGHAAEALLHALVAMVHIQLIAGLPELARLGTELCRRQNSLAISLLNSRRPATWRLRLRAPDGLGTIPGGNPAMQTPDFWSIPFAPPRDDPAPPLLEDVIDHFVADAAVRPSPLRFEESLADWIDEHGRQSMWLPPADQLAAAEAIGLVAAGP